LYDMQVVRVVDDASKRAALAKGAELLRAGRLVAFPTETVYGLGANALDETAVQRIYEAKGRPALNPVIVHVASAAAARELALDWPAAAEAIARAFWPGPLTVVVRKRPVVPDIVSAGGETVGLRVPAHPLALALLEEARVPVAAPSANLSTQVSPTTAQHVERGLGDRVDLIIDGGPTHVGIESTVVDVTGGVPRILRPGMIARDEIARVAGAAEARGSPGATETLRSPGMMARHYAPRARLRLVPTGTMDESLGTLRNAARAGALSSTRVGALSFTHVGADVTRLMPREAVAYARLLYAALHDMDEERCDVVLVERPPATPEWAAIIDRLERAAR
jgi:L-threonylcarbamoyladenylate synthase